MTVVTGTPADATAVRPFTFEAAEADLQELCASIATTHWPEKETHDDQSQSVQLAPIKALARLHFDLWSYDEVKANAEAIIGQLTGGNMPCDGGWPDEQVELFRAWIADGVAA